MTRPPSPKYPRRARTRLPGDFTVGCGQPPPGVTSGRVCARTGTHPSCQLCPDSPTYWRLTPPGPPPPTVPVPPPTPVAGVSLDWRAGSHWSGRPAPCRRCGLPTPLVDENRVPCHKTCAETEAAAGRDTGPGDPRQGRLG